VDIKESNTRICLTAWVETITAQICLSPQVTKTLL